MQIEDYYEFSDGKLRFTRSQGSQFAKHVAEDFNPLHDADASRFCVPGDLLFSVILARYGISAHMECTFAGMVTEGTELVLPEPAESLSIVDAQEREYLRIERSGENTLCAETIQNLSRQYVQFSGHSFPDLLVPLLAEHEVMINPQRPMVMYQSMSIDLDRVDIREPALCSDTSELSIDGKRGMAVLAFKLLDGDEPVGSGQKRILLSGLRPYDDEQMAGVVAVYEKRKEVFSGQNG
ncbi:MAG: DUF3581 family protein [Halioglobus sp.]